MNNNESPTDEQFDLVDDLIDQVIITNVDALTNDSPQTTMRLLVYLAIGILGRIIACQKPFYRKKLADKIVAEVKKELLSPKLLFLQTGSRRPHGK